MSIRNYCHLALATSLMLALDAAPVRAQEQAAPSNLRALAQSFVEKMRGGFQQADDYYRTYYAGDIREQESFSGIPDGELLLLEIVLPKRLKLADPVMAIKQGRDVMLSLSDFANIARFRIDVLADQRKAEGWFIRENKPFSLDLATGEVLAGTEVYTIREGDVLEQDGDLFIRADALSTWMDIEMEISLQTQSIAVKNTETWPVQAAMDRRNRKVSTGQRPPVMPLEEDPYGIIGPANVDINMRQEYRKAGEEGAKAVKRSSYTLRSDSDLANHTATAVLSGSNEEPLSTARVTFSKESAEPDLLGPIGARYYEFGDITPARVRAAGPAKGGLGARATNKNPNVTTEAATQVTGEGTPGWDVEIYRGSQLLANGVVDEGGRYFFDDILLVPGENVFRIVQYGPFGELLEDQQNLYAGTDLLNMDRGVYDVSITASDTQFYENSLNAQNDETHQPQIAAQYEKQIAEGVAGRLGVVSGTIKDERKNYLSSGVTTSIGESLVSLDGGYDIDGAWQTSASARRRFGAASGSVTGTYTSEGFASQKDSPAPSSYSTSTNFRTPLGTLFNRPLIYNTEHEYRVTDGGEKSFDSEMGLSGYINRFTFGQSLFREWDETAEGEARETIGGQSNLNGSLLGVRWRASSIYDFTPETQARRYLLDLSKPIQKNLRANLDLEHDPLKKISEGTGSLSFYGKHATITPSLSYDTENNLGAFVNVGVGLAYEPRSSSVVFFGRSVGGQGGVSARVYLDQDGDQNFSEGDELIEGATVEAIHSNRRVETNEEGIAFIHNLAAGRLTDVIVRENSLPDAFWISAREGVSVLPRPGNTTEIDFPIHIGGEIDGTVYAVEPEGNKVPLRNIRLNLHRLSDGAEIKTTTAAADGFYIFDRVPPGDYFLLVNPQDALRYGVASPPPQTIKIGYEGTTLYGNNLLLNKGPSVGIIFPEDLQAYVDTYPDIDFSKLGKEKFILNLGSYNSNLMMALAWYKMKQHSGELRQFAEPLVESSQSRAIGTDAKHILRVALKGKSLDEARNLCLRLGSQPGLEGTPCIVEMLPEHNPVLVQKAALEEKE